MVRNASLLLVLVAGLLVAAADPATEPDQRTRDHLQGSWTMVYAEDRGRKQDVPRDAILRVSRDTFTVCEAGVASEKGKLTLDWTKHPPTVDFYEDGKLRYKGIFAVQGDRLLLCLDSAKEERPSVFRTRKGSSTEFFILKRKRK